MATTWAVTLLLVGYFSVYDGVAIRFSSYRGSTSYRSYRSYGSYRSNGNYGTYNYCSSSTCKSLSSYYGFLALIPLGLVLFFVLMIYCGMKKKSGVSPSPPEPLATSSGTSGVERSNGEKPITHYPIPPTIKANDPPPPYDSSDPAHPLGQNGRQINTRTLPPGTIRQPPSVPAPAWQAPPPGAPPQSDNPPMPQPDPPKTSKPHPPTTSPSDDNPLATAPGASGIHPPPVLTHLPPSDIVPTTAAPTEGESY